MQRYPSALAVIALALAACGGKHDAPKAKDDAAPGPPVAPLAMPPSGVDKIARMNFVYGDGWPTYEKAAAARAKKRLGRPRERSRRARSRRTRITSTRTGCSRRSSRRPESTPRWSITWSPRSPTTTGATGRRSPPTRTSRSSARRRTASRCSRSRARSTTTIRSGSPRGVWLVGRRSTFKWPREPGVQGADHARRALRLRSRDPPLPAADATPITGSPASCARPVVPRSRSSGSTRSTGPRTTPRPPRSRGRGCIVLDTTEWKPLGPKLVLPAARELALGYGAGDQLLVSTAPAAGRWAIGDATVMSVDKAAGKATKVATPAPVPRIALTLDEGRVVRDDGRHRGRVDRRAGRPRPRSRSPAAP